LAIDLNRVGVGKGEVLDKRQDAAIRRIVTVVNLLVAAVGDFDMDLGVEVRAGEDDFSSVALRIRSVETAGAGKRSLVSLSG
jgi:hypothetical protein